MSCCDEQPTRPERAGLRPSSESSSYHARTRKMTMYFSCNLCITLSSRDQNNIKSDARTMDIGPAAAAVQHNAHNLRTPKHEGLYRDGRRCGRHNLLLHRSGCCCCCETHTRTTSGPPSTRASIAMDGGVADCCCCSTQRVHTVTGPPSTGAAITMDGGVADTTRGNIVVTHQAVPRQSVGEEKARY